MSVEIIVLILCGLAFCLWMMIVSPLKRGYDTGFFDGRISLCEECIKSGYMTKADVTDSMGKPFIEITWKEKK